MPADMKITGFVMAHLTPKTFGDLVRMVDQLLQWGVQEEAEIMDGYLDFDLSNGPVDVIECMDHVPGKELPVYDWLLLTHTHETDEKP